MSVVSQLTEPCKVCGAAPGESCPTEAEPLCGELRPDGAPCIRSLGHGTGHRATCLRVRTLGDVARENPESYEAAVLRAHTSNTEKP